MVGGSDLSLIVREWSNQRSMLQEISKLRSPCLRPRLCGSKKVRIRRVLLKAGWPARNAKWSVPGSSRPINYEVAFKLISGPGMSGGSAMSKIQFSRSYEELDE